jgi:hypothetical protein
MSGNLVQSAADAMKRTDCSTATCTQEGARSVPERLESRAMIVRESADGSGEPDDRIDM